MKNKFLYIMAGWAVALFASCQEAAKFQDVILFTGTENSAKVSLTVEGATDMGVTITATDKVEKDTKVTLTIGTQADLDVYNKETGKSYVLPPAESIGLSSGETVIKSGNYISEAVRFSVKSVDALDMGSNYCVTIVITGTDGDMSVLESSRVMYVVLNRVLVGRAVVLNGGGAFHVPQFMTDSRVGALGAASMEIKVCVDRWQTDTWTLSTLMGIEENFLLRFSKVNGVPNTLEIGPIFVSGKKAFVHTDRQCVTDRWYHVACVFDGSSAAIYVNGELDVKYSVPTGTLNLNDDYFDGFWIGQSCNGRGLIGAVSEARFWNKALTTNEIQDNMCYVDPMTDGLLACWIFNEPQDDGRFLDVTGNGFDAFPKGGYTWRENIKCPF